MAVCVRNFPFLLPWRMRSASRIKSLRESSEYYFLDCKHNSTFCPILCFSKMENYDRRNVGKCKCFWRKSIQVLIHKRLNSSGRKNDFFHSQCTHSTSYQTRNMSGMKKMAVSNEYVISILQRCSSVLEQMEELYRTVNLTSDDLENRAKICSELENVLRPYYPNCSVHLFGSSVNGFGFKGSDIDITLQSNCGFHEEESSREFVRFPSIDDVRSGKIPLQTLHQLPSRSQLGFIRTVLENSPDFHRVEYVGGRCPIIEFSYGQDGLNCDLAFDNRDGFRSTKLLYLCGKLDRRVLLLQTTLSYWAKRVHLIGGVSKFKSYALSLLLIYFLQTRNPPVLPTLEYIFLQSGFFQSDYSWDYQVSKDVEKFEPSKNTESADDLLREFFPFYFHFNYTQVISPLTGSCKNIYTIYKIADPTTKQFQANSICLEDPLNVSWNVTCGVNFRICKAFLKQLHVVCKLYENQKYWCPNEKIWGIAQLFDRNSSEQLLRMCENVVSMNVILKPQTIDILAKELGISKNSTNLKDIWLQRSSQIVRALFEDGFLFKCLRPERQSVIASEHLNIKSRAVIGNSCGNVTSDVGECYNHVNEEAQHSDTNGKKLYLHMQCIAHDTWQKRDNYRKKFEPFLTLKTPLERENFLSVRTSQCNHGNNEPKFAFNCECQESEVNGMPSLLIKFEPIESVSFPPKLAVFLKEYVPEVVNSLM